MYTIVYILVVLLFHLFLSIESDDSKIIIIPSLLIVTLFLVLGLCSLWLILFSSFDKDYDQFHSNYPPDSVRESYLQLPNSVWFRDK